MPFDQLPIALAVPVVVVIGADRATDGVKPQPQPGAMAVDVQISGYVDPLLAGPCAAIVQTRKAGSASWFNLTSSRENEVDANGSYSIILVDPILDDVRVFFDVNGHVFNAYCTFLADAPLALA